jgi:arylsulfatase A-like enzyme
VFTSDNGIAVGEHGWNYKLTPYEESIRVPLVMRYDPMSGGGSSTDALAANVDIAPTIADVAGVSAPSAEGRSLVPIIDGTATGVRDEVVLEHVRYRPRGADPPTYCAMRTEDRLFVRYATGEEELYDLDRDPWQLQNLAAVRSRRSELDALRRRTTRACRPVPPGFSWRRSDAA